MTSVIERAARALQKAWDAHDAPAMLPPLTFTDEEGHYLVRAVLQAIREPSEGMVEAGSLTLLLIDLDFIDEQEGAAKIFSSMIDTALTE